MLRLNTIFLGLSITSFLIGCGENTDIKIEENIPLKETLSSKRNEPIDPIKMDNSLNKDKVKLGKQLFHDVRLSGDNKISCGSCHNVTTNGTVNAQYAKGINGELGQINTPTVFNSRFNFKQFWNGSSKDLVDQVQGPIHNPIEMGSSWNEIIEKLKNDNDLQLQSQEIFGTNLSPEIIASSIAEFEKSLITPSRFDDYLMGQDNAITPEELEGYNTFKNYGCISCHQGQNIGGNMFQLLGISHSYFEGKELTEADYGRYSVTKNERDKHFFKVPSLRNVELTAPYFHDGSIATLDSAVRAMAYYQVGLSMPDEDVQKIVSFLKSLTMKDGTLNND